MTKADEISVSSCKKIKQRIINNRSKQKIFGRRNFSNVSFETRNRTRSYNGVRQCIPNINNTISKERVYPVQKPQQVWIPK